MTRPIPDRQGLRKTPDAKATVAAGKDRTSGRRPNRRTCPAPPKRRGADRRAYTRRRYSVPVAVSYFSGEFLFDTWTLNHGLGGLCFVSRRPLEPGAVLCIQVKKFHPAGPCTGICEGLRSITLAEVVWTDKVFGDGAIAWHSGVRYYESVY